MSKWPVSLMEEPLVQTHFVLSTFYSEFNCVIRKLEEDLERRLLPRSILYWSMICTSVIAALYVKSSFAKPDKSFSKNDLKPSFSRTLLGVHTHKK